jgi:6-phosphogluconolactonase
VTAVRVFDSPDALAEAVARFLASRAMEILGGGRSFRIGLSGGRTPVAVYRILGAGRAAPVVDWSGATFLFADERDAPPSEPESNYWEVRKFFLEPAGVPPARVHRMKADQPDLEAAALEYDALLQEPLDLLVLGIGEDGHTASLFPGSRWIAERARRVVAVHDSPKPPPRRLTITPRVIEEAREVIVLATGAAKAKAVAAALRKEEDPARVPARLLREHAWYVDSAAAGEVASGVQRRRG